MSNYYTAKCQFFALNLEKITPGKFFLHKHRWWCLWQIWGMVKKWRFSGPKMVPGGRPDTRVEWIHVFLEIEKGPSNFRCTSQHWFHNNWRNCDPMNILSQKWPNISYRCKKCLPIFGRGYSSDNNFVNCYGISAVTYTGNCSGLLQNDVKICKTKNGQTT